MGAHALRASCPSPLHSCGPHTHVRRLLDSLDLYKPLVWEYSRLNITNTVMSKRKLNTLVMGGHVHGWDDPRLLTLAGACVSVCQ